jgi:acetyl esterase
MEWRSTIFAKTAFLIMGDAFPANNSVSVANERIKIDLTTQVFFSHGKFMRPEIGKVPFQDVHIPVTLQKDSMSETKDTILIRIYTPATAAETVNKLNKLRPVIVWYHGGGWVLGSAVGEHIVCTKLALESNYIVVNVDYRMAPNFPFPVPPNDSYEALQWVSDHIAEYGGDASQIIVAGESAGGNLATAMIYKSISEADKHNTCQESEQQTCSAAPLRGKIVGAIVVSAALDNDTNTTEAKEYDHSSGILQLSTMAWFRELYQGSPGWNEEIRSDPLYAPLLTPKSILERYPPTVFVLAKYDVLTHENVLMVKKLEAENRPVSMAIYPSTIHWFYGKTILSGHGDEALAQSVRDLKRLLDGQQ